MQTSFTTLSLTATRSLQHLTATAALVFAAALPASLEFVDESLLALLELAQQAVKLNGAA